MKGALRVKVEGDYSGSKPRTWQVWWSRGGNYWNSCGLVFHMRARADEFARHIRQLQRQGRAE